MKCQTTELKVIATTDDLGSHVTVTGPDTHLVSQPQESHEAAESLVRLIMMLGLAEYREWNELQSPPLVE